MKNCKIPCSECPFTKSSLPGWLGEYKGPEELHNLVMSEKYFPCHMSHDETIPFEEVEDNYPLCAGALMYMKKAYKLPRDKKLASIVKQINRENLEDILSVLEFITHHEQYKK